jgi:hypothetical protein
MNYRLLILCSVFSAACADDPAEGTICSGEEADINRVPTARLPDWETIQVYSSSGDPLGKAQDVDLENSEDLYREHIQVWDCLTLSWWTPTEPKKVVQIWTDDTQCELYEMSSMGLYACDSHDSEDDYFRDRDEDGFYASEGDCNDESAEVSPVSEERCDQLDNDCDGIADEYLDCSDIETADDDL